MKKLLLLTILISTSLILGSCATKNNGQTIKQEAKDIEKKISQTEQGIVVPGNLEKCNIDQYFSKDAQTGNLMIKTDCIDLPEEAVCNYYKTRESDGTEPVHVAEYNNECSYCRFYFGKEKREIGGKTFIDLGIERKACTQGMYKK